MRTAAWRTEILISGCRVALQRASRRGVGEQEPTASMASSSRRWLIVQELVSPARVIYLRRLVADDSP